MTKSDLYEALEELNREKMTAISRMEAEAEEHTFSEEFELKMDRLIRKWRRKFVKASNYRLRKSWVAAAVVALILSVTMSVEASRAAIIRFVIEMYEKYSNIGYEENDVKYAPDEILEYREPVWGEEYVEVERVEDPYLYKIIRENVVSGNKIYYRQCVIGYYDNQANTEYESIVTEELMEGITIHSITYDGYTMLFWNDGIYYYEMNSNIEKAELLRLVRTIYEEK